MFFIAYISYMCIFHTHSHGNLHYENNKTHASNKLVKYEKLSEKVILEQNTLT